MNLYLFDVTKSVYLKNLSQNESNKIDYLLNKMYFLPEEISEKNLVIKEFVSMSKKYANINTPYMDKH